MNDRDLELLKLAAKAAHRQVARESDTGRGLLLVGEQHVWNPLDDDGDALRLANDTDTSIEFGYCLDDAPVVRCGYYAERENWPQECNFPDPYKATRRAIVEAVARKQQEYEAATAGLEQPT